MDKAGRDDRRPAATLFLEGRLTPMRLSRMNSLQAKRGTSSRVISSIWMGFTLPRTAPDEMRTAAVQKSALTMLGRRGKAWGGIRRCWL